MDRTDLGVRGDRPRSPATGPGISDPEQQLWQQLAEAPTPEAFYRAWLALQCRMIPGTGNGVVVLGDSDSGAYAPAAFWPEGRRNVRHLAEVAEKALVEGKGLVIPRQPPERREGEPPPRAHYDVAYPIQFVGRLRGVVALDIAPRYEADLQIALRQLQWGASWLEAHYLRGEVGRSAAVSTRLQTVFDLVATAFGEDDFRASATSFVTAVATRLGCDRVSIGFVRGGRVRVRAVSHSARFGDQTNLMRAVAAAMDEAIDQQASIVYPPPDTATPRVTRAHAELAQQHGSGAVCSVPLTEGGRVFGALTFERPGDQPFDESAMELCEALAALAGPVLERTRRDDRSIVAKIGDSLRAQAAAVVGPRRLGLKASLAGAAAVLVFLVVGKGDFRVPAHTVLEPLVRQASVAPFTGYIASAPARAGDAVRAGQVLAVLDDRELQLQRQKWQSQQEQLVRQYNQAMAMRNAALVVILSAQIDQARAEVALLDDQLRRTRLTAPFDGIVVTGDLSQSLAAPVERGQLLFEVAPLDAYRMILEVDERDIAYVSVGQRGTLVLTGAPADGVRFAVEKLTPVSTAREGRNYFRVEARLEEGRERLRPGMDGVAKVDIDRRRLIWIWTRQIVDWVRLQIWTWLP